MSHENNHEATVENAQNPTVDDSNEVSGHAEKQSVQSQETQGVGAEGEGESQLESMSQEELIAEVKRNRRENASRRLKAKELEEAASKWQEHQEAQKSELQREQEARARLEQERDDLARRYAAAELAAQYGITADDIDLLGSGTREEMESRARRIAEYQAASQNVTPPSQRPVEHIRTGGGQRAAVEDDLAYPESWAPKANRQ